MNHSNQTNPSPASEDRAPEHDVGAALRRIACSSADPSRALAEDGLVDGVPELAALASVPQDPRWHPEGDVLTHSLLAMDSAATLWNARRELVARRGIVVLAALFHDVGKPSTTRVDGASIVSPGHAEVGEQLMLRIGDRLGWPAAETRAVSALIRHHMAHLSVVGDPTSTAVRRLKTRLVDAGTSLQEWSIVVDADGAARGSAANSKRAALWLRVDSTSS